MVDIFIPNKGIQGSAINLPGNAHHGKIWFKHANGVLTPLGPGAPSWESSVFSGTPQTAVASFVPMQAPTQTVFYVDSADGNDNNIGTSSSAPFRTLVKALTVHSGGDHIYLKRGGRWRERLHPLSGGPYIKSGPSPLAMTTVSFYGSSGARPILESSLPMIDTYNRGGLQNLALDGLHIYGYAKDPLNPDFGGGGGKGASLDFKGGNARNILLQDLLIDYSELAIQPSSQNNNFPGMVDGFTVINCIWTGNYGNHTTYTDQGKPSNVFISPMLNLTCRGLVLDYGGWHPTVADAGANQFCHNVYLVASGDPSVSNSYLWENCIVSRGASHGIHGRPGGTYRNMFFSRNAIGLQIGYAATAMGVGATPLVEDCVVSECYSMWKGNDVTPIDTTRTLRSGAKWGFNFENYGGALITARNNISQIGYVAGDDRPPSTSVNGFALQGGPIHSNVNNRVWQFPNQTGSYSDPGRTLADYEVYLNGFGSYDTFMTRVKNRPLRGWDYRYTAEAINAYIEEGYAP